MSKIFILAVLFLAEGIILSCPAMANPDVDYGQMYVIEKQEAKKGLWGATLAYTYGFSNPYLSIHGAQIDFTRKVTEYFNLGLSPAIYKSARKGLADQLSDQLGAQGIQTNVFEPLYSGHVVAEIIPLAGLLNWFSTTAVDFDLAVQAGVGAIRYKQSDGAIPSFRFGLVPRVMLSRFLGVSAGVQTTLERFAQNDWQNRFETVFGISGRF